MDKKLPAKLQPRGLENLIRSLFSREPTKTAVFEVIGKGAAFRKKYRNDLSYFGNELKSKGKEKEIASIAWMGRHKGSDSQLEVVFWSSHVTVQKITRLLGKYGLKAQIAK